MQALLVCLRVPEHQEEATPVHKPQDSETAFRELWYVEHSRKSLRDARLCSDVSLHRTGNAPSGSCPATTAQLVRQPRFRES